MRNKMALCFILASIICSVSVGFMVTPVSAEQGWNPWPMFHHDPQRAGYTQFSGPLAVPPAVKTGWPFSATDAVMASPVIGRHGMVYIGSWDHYLYAINPGGTQEWSFFTTDFGKIDSSAGIGADGTIYVGTHEQGTTRANFFAINPDGTPKWNLGSIRGIQVPPGSPSAIIGSSPLIVENDPFTGQRAIYVGTADGDLHKIVEGTPGSVVWSTHLSVSDIYAGFPSSPATYDKSVIYVGIRDDNVIYTGSDSTQQNWGYLVAVDAQNGNILRHIRLTTTKGETVCSPVVEMVSGQVTICAGTSDQRLKAVIDDGATLTQKWDYLHPPGGGIGACPAVCDLNGDGYVEVVVGSGDSFVFAVTDGGVNNPSLLWDYQTGGSIISSVAIDTNKVSYVGSMNPSFISTVYAIDALGNLKWTQSLGTTVGQIISSPALAPGGELYVATGSPLMSNPTVYCIGGENVFIKDCPDDDGIIPSWDANYNGIWDGIPPDRAYWVSPDIRVDRPPYWPPDPPPGQGPNEENPVRGETDHIYAYVHNIGSVTATNTVVEFYWADYGVGNPPWPGGFTLIGNCVIPSIDPGATEYCFVSWAVPTNIPEHTCIWVRLECDTDPIVSDDPGWENNIGWKNFYIKPLKKKIVDSLVFYEAAVDFKVRNPDGVVADVCLDLYSADLSYNWTMELTSHDHRFGHVPDGGNKYVFSSMRPGEVGTLTLIVAAPIKTEKNNATIHIAGTIDRKIANRNIGGISMKVVPPIRKIIDETMYNNSITQPINVSRIRFVHNAVNEKWVKGSKWPIPMELMYWQKSTKYLIEIDIDGNGNVTRVGFRRWGNPITEIPYDLAEQSLASLPPGFAIGP